MDSTIQNDNLNLITDQVNTALGAFIVQTESVGGQRYIEIAPILVVAAASVPLPGALVLCLSAIGSVGLFGGLGRRSAA